MNVEKRLTRLEKQNRNLRRGLVGLLLVVPLMAWQDKKTRDVRFGTVRADRIILKGKSMECLIVPGRVTVRRRQDLHPKQPPIEASLTASDTGATMRLAAGSMPGPMNIAPIAKQLATMGVALDGVAGCTVRGSTGTIDLSSHPDIPLYDSDKEPKKLLGVKQRELAIRLQPVNPKHPLQVLPGVEVSGSGKGCSIAIHDSKGSVIHQVPKK